MSDVAEIKRAYYEKWRSALDGMDFEDFYLLEPEHKAEVLAGLDSAFKAYRRLLRVRRKAAIAAADVGD